MILFFFWKKCGQCSTRCCSTTGWFMGCSGRSTKPKRCGREGLCGQNANEPPCSFPKIRRLTSLGTEDNEQEIFCFLSKYLGFQTAQMQGEGRCWTTIPFFFFSVPGIFLSFVMKNTPVKWRTDEKVSDDFNDFFGCWLRAKMIFPRLL